MVVAKHLSIVLFVTVFTSAKTPDIENSVKSCPKSATVDLTPVNKSDNENTSGYICDIKYCIPLCCPVKFSASVSSCVANESTERTFDFYKPNSKNVRFFTENNSCNSMWKESDSRISGSRDALRYVKLFDGDIHLADFCLLPKPNETINSTTSTCEDHPVVGVEDTWALVCSSFTIFFKLITLIVYIVVPELNKNLQGWIIISFLASDIGNTFLIILNLVLLRRICMKGNFYIAMGFVANLCGFSYIMWLNVMSFDIWKKFRTFRSTQDMDIEKRRRTAYFRYSIYVWGTSIVDATIILFWLNLSMTSYSDSQKKLMRLFLFGVPGLVVFICNTFFYTSTALKIMQCKKETANMIRGVNKHHHQKNQQWFNLYLKLFIMSGCPMILWAVVYFWDNDMFELFVHSTETLQGLFIFLMFVWKDDVKGSIRELFSGRLHRLTSHFRHNSTPDRENKHDERVN